MAKPDTPNPKTIDGVTPKNVKLVALSPALRDAKHKDASPPDGPGEGAQEGQISPEGVSDNSSADSVAAMGPKGGR